jgi:Rrf2 family transcriptional regulator, nitric oxide-sensitive transcriptional repressor
MLSQTAEYALRATVHLGEQNGSPRTVQQIADAIRAPSGYLAKVLQAMSKAGIVNSKRGLHGGFVLGGPPEEISVYDVLQAVDPIKRYHSCPLKIESHQELCPLHRQLDDALALVEDVFRSATISELLAGGATSTFWGENRRERCDKSSDHSCDGSRCDSKRSEQSS